MNFVFFGNITEAITAMLMFNMYEEEAVYSYEERHGVYAAYKNGEPMKIEDQSFYSRRMLLDMLGIRYTWKYNFRVDGETLMALTEFRVKHWTTGN
jgi:hypothetical protein